MNIKFKNSMIESKVYVACKKIKIKMRSNINRGGDVVCICCSVPVKVKYSLPNNIWPRLLKEKVKLLEQKKGRIKKKN